MKGFLISVLASIVAAAIFLATPYLTKFFSHSEIYLDVEVVKENWTPLWITHIVARNTSQYGFDPMEFNFYSDGKLIRLFLRKPDGSIINQQSASNGQSIPFQLGAGEQIEIVEIAEGGSLTSEVNRLFSGAYSVIGQRGMIEKKPMGVRTSSDAQKDLIFLIAKLLSAFISVVLVATVFFLLRRKRKSKVSQTGPSEPPKDAPSK
jgi:hypothetical protein